MGLKFASLWEQVVNYTCPKRVGSGDLGTRTHLDLSDQLIGLKIGDVRFTPTKLYNSYTVLFGTVLLWTSA